MRIERSQLQKARNKKKMNIAKRQNSYVIIGENDEQRLITKSKYSDFEFQRDIQFLIEILI